MSGTPIAVPAQKAGPTGPAVDGDVVAALGPPPGLDPRTQVEDLGEFAARQPDVQAERRALAYLLGATAAAWPAQSWARPARISSSSSASLAHPAWRAGSSQAR